MSHAALIINHIHFPYRLFEQAVKWSHFKKAPLKVVFLTYDPLEDPAARPIILQQMKDVEEQRILHDVQIENIILDSPGLQGILVEVHDAKKIFIEIQDEESMKKMSFSWPDLMSEIGRNRQVVSNKAFGDRSV